MASMLFQTYTDPMTQHQTCTLAIDMVNHVPIHQSLRNRKKDNIPDKNQNTFQNRTAGRG